jgi:hypothetical protein
MPPPLPSRKFPWLIYLIVLAAILAVALAPVGSVVVAGLIAKSHGCQLDEGGVYPCVIGGTDYGTTLNTMFGLGWLMLLTLPVGALAVLAWAVVLVIHRIRWRRKLSMER